MVPKLGLPTKYPSRVMNKQCGNIGDIIESYNMGNGGRGGYLMGLAMSSVMLELVLLPVLHLWRLGRLAT